MKKTLHVFACACIALLTLPATAQVPAYVPTDGLVGWWPFNGNANDESGNGNDGVVNGATLTEDRFGITGHAYSFDGQSNYIDLGDWEIGGELSISIWANYSSFNFMSRILNFSNGQYENSIVLANDLNTDSGYLSIECLTTQTLPNLYTLNEWNFYVLQFLPNSICNIYKNGILFSTISMTCELPSILRTNQYLGKSDFTNDGFFSGKLDELGIWNRALTEQEIQNLYTGTTPPPCVSLPSNLQQGLVGYWPFCGNANDESGNGNDGTVNGATLAEDRFGNANAAYSFDGVDDFIELPNSYLIDSLYDFSVSAWVFSNNLNVNFQHLISKDTMGPPPNGDWDFYLRNNRFKFEITLNSPTFEQQSNAVLQENTWHHLQMVREASSGVVSLYVNGIFDSSFIGHTGANYNFQKMVFGKQGSSNLHFFNGSLDDIAIYNRALTPEEVQELYTLDACTFIVYDTSYVTVYDTLTTYETVYDTLYTYETIYDTVTTYITVTDTLLIDITFTGIEGQPSWLNTVTVFPNPASDHITIDYGNFALMAGYNTIITDAAGATVYSSAVNSQQAYIDINAWGAAGVYYMTIYDASGTAVAVRHIVLE